MLLQKYQSQIKWCNITPRALHPKAQSGPGTSAHPMLCFGKKFQLPVMSFTPPHLFLLQRNEILSITAGKSLNFQEANSEKCELNRNWKIEWCFGWGLTGNLSSWKWIHGSIINKPHKFLTFLKGVQQGSSKYMHFSFITYFEVKFRSLHFQFLLCCQVLLRKPHLNP